MKYILDKDNAYVLMANTLCVSFNIFKKTIYFIIDYLNIRIEAIDVFTEVIFWAKFQFITSTLS